MLERAVSGKEQELRERVGGVGGSGTKVVKASKFRELEEGSPEVGGIRNPKSGRIRGLMEMLKSILVQEFRDYIFDPDVFV